MMRDRSACFGFELRCLLECSKRIIENSFGTIMVLETLYHGEGTRTKVTESMYTRLPKTLAT